MQKSKLFIKSISVKSKTFPQAPLTPPKYYPFYIQPSDHQLSMYKEQVNEDVKNSSVSRELWPFFRISSYFGLFPLSKKRGESVYKLKALSFPALFSTFVGTALVFIYVLDFMEKNLWNANWFYRIFMPLTEAPNNQTQFNLTLNGTVIFKQNSIKRRSWIYNGLDALSIIYKFQMVVAIWIGGSRFAKFLNNWNSFEREFANQFSNLMDFDIQIRNFRRLVTLAYIVSPITLITSLHFLKNVTAVRKDFWLFLFRFVRSLGSACAFAFEDAKHIIMYRVLQKTFEKIRKGIELQYEVEPVSRNKNFESHISFWMKILRSVRQQCFVMCNDCETFRQFLLLLIIVCHITNCMFEILQIVSLPSNKTTVSKNRPGLITVGMDCIIIIQGFFILGVKCLMAERVTQEEKLIVAKLQAIQVSVKDSRSQLKLKMLIDLLTKYPTQITLNGFITVNKRLILTIAQQSLTYLIIMMQFTVGK